MAKEKRDGKRRMRDSRAKRIPDLGYYFIVTDAEETEENYLHGLRDALPKEIQGRIVIKVFHAGTDELVQVCKDKASMQPQYAEPWIVFDRDRVVGFDEIIRKAELSGVKAAWSNPCIEVWFDAYFGKMHNYTDSATCCERFGEIFKRQTGQEYKKSNYKIYEILNRHGDEEKAIEIAEMRIKNYSGIGESRPSQMYSCTTLHRLVSEIKQKINMQQ